ncbi:hypothetical protein [Pelagibius litoralis]|uniref:hypothetical protein n=1 Tax=Pelagibius litoralis TaxID=374515 RepID=UPI00197FDC7F|nr:hypothetical protein [Pelagibius litoralis]
MCWERVVTIEDFYDGPRGGVAFLNGRLHVFESVFDKARDEYSEEFNLTPIDEALLPLIEEKWKIWTRWATAYHAGKTSSDTNPALPADRPRHDELKATLDPLLVTDSAKAVRRLGEFRDVDIMGSDHDAEVRWSLSKDQK